MMSTKFLYVSANPKGENESYSLKVGRAFIEQYKILNPDHEVTELDLFKTDVPVLNAVVFDGFSKLQNGGSFSDLDQEQKQQLGKLNQLLEQFMEADSYAFVNPMWNFSVPPVLKAYIDVILQVGKTFHYTENGPEGLMKGKKAIHIQASGGIYSKGAAVEMDFSHRYLKTVLGFTGISELEFVPVEGIAMGQTKVSEIVKLASEKAIGLASEF
ncbi:FMN-dependent NADH-azoreductase [Labilibaculum antarcticum]|uniref:FMN dependent NADH:quinone oxidoreductase n=2 Tax=Labilibaculum antarcticum TaxID=1717717 RepID=A0A1Y1CN64_9BACT|nr:FMN-dependent NADH-azoreductase [Labilibaculum antarcticum]